MSSNLVELAKGPLTVNVGGVRFTTTISTLTKYADSMLGRMFSGEFSTATDAEGAFFIDRDGNLFHHVLNFLRTDRLTVSNQPADVEVVL